MGIAEQNLINISCGLALEGFKVYAYAIAPFLTMRAYEQNRNNLSLFAQLRALNINLIGVGAGLSYDVSGPTHHCLEDIALMRIFPNFIVISPSDNLITSASFHYSLSINKPKYLRLDAKPFKPIYKEIRSEDFQRGFCHLLKGNQVCLVSTGFMTQVALKAAHILRKQKVSCGLLDLFIIKPVDEEILFGILKNYKCIITLEEAFIGKGGLDSTIASILIKRKTGVVFENIGVKDAYIFEQGGRQYLHKINGLDVHSIVKVAEKCLKRRNNGY